MIDNTVAQEIKNAVLAANKILITGHYSPDGDALGSTLGLQKWIEGLGKESHVMMPNKFAKNLKWIPGCENVHVFESNEEKAITLIESCDLVFILDYNHLGRLKKMGEHINPSQQKTILIDHHRQPDEFDINVSDVTASSTCQLVFELLDSLKEPISKDTATCLYTGLMTDTGSFKYSVTPAVHRMAASIVEAGADANAIQNAIFNQGKKDKLQLMGYALYEKMVVKPEWGVAYIALTAEELKRFNYESGDTEGLVNMPLSIEGINVSAFFKEDKGIIKTSFRSVGKYSVNDFSRAHFNGGGHANAAGGMSPDNWEITLKRFTNEIQKDSEAILNS